MYQTILVPVDGSQLSERALPYARVLAAATKARLILVRVIASLAIDDEHTFDGSEGRSNVETYVQNLAASHIDSIPIEADVVVGDAAPAILAEAARTAADVIVMSTHGRSGIGRWIYGSVADAVMRQSTLPVLLIPATCSRVWTTDGSSRILVPLDGSDLSEAVLGPASDLAESSVADLDLIGRRGDRAAIADVVAALGSDDMDVKEQAAKTLGRLGGSPAIEALLRALRAEHTYLDATITRALVHIGPDAVPSLVHALVDPSEIVRWHAAEALADIGDPRATQPLLDAIEDSDPAVRWHAARGLAHLGEPALISLLHVLETRPLTPWLSQDAKYVLRHVALGKPSRELHDLASALNHPTASVEVPLRAAEAITALTSTSAPAT